MSWWGVYALVVVAVPMVSATCVLVTGWWKRRRRKRLIASQQRDWSVAAICVRVERERADADLAQAPTELLPAVPRSVDDRPTDRLPRLKPPLPRRYVRPRSALPARRPPDRPDQALLQRVLEGLRQLPETPARSEERRV